MLRSEALQHGSAPRNADPTAGNEVSSSLMHASARGPAGPITVCNLCEALMAQHNLGWCPSPPEIPSDAEPRLLQQAEWLHWSNIYNHMHVIFVDHGGCEGLKPSST